ncbi:hypothetical protein ACGFNU_22930 [Spirillospora sp. NPDC048911]|uniref:hypothetical protein n=1 Tax=Spirillospora sp. NPDC048911 TaxID=3364527 RepID=UPI003718EEAF
MPHGTPAAPHPAVAALAALHGAPAAPPGALQGTLAALHAALAAPRRGGGGRAVC